MSFQPVVVCPKCQTTITMSRTPLFDNALRCPRCDAPIPAAGEGSHDHSIVYEAELADDKSDMAGQGLPSAPPDSQPTRSSKRVYALIILASVTVIAVVTVTYVIFLLLGTQPNIPIGEGQQAKGDGNPASTGQHGKETALSKEDGGAGKKDVLPPIPAIPPPPKLPSLDPEVAQTVMAEKRAQLIGTWHTDLPYPITLTYQPDGQVILILKPPQGASRQIEARWKVTEAVTRQVLAIEWEGPSQRRQRFDVVFELGGDIQHPIWGQPRLIPRFSKKE